MAQIQPKVHQARAFIAAGTPINDRLTATYVKMAAAIDGNDLIALVSLVDGMRGRSSLWYRVRVNLIHVPEAERPEQEPLAESGEALPSGREALVAHARRDG